jgi:hypothetical protein
MCGILLWLPARMQGVEYNQFDALFPRVRVTDIAFSAFPNLNLLISCSPSLPHHDHASTETEYRATERVARECWWNKKATVRADRRSTALLFSDSLISSLPALTTSTKIRQVATSRKTRSVPVPLSRRAEVLAYFLTMQVRERLAVLDPKKLVLGKEKAGACGLRVPKADSVRYPIYKAPARGSSRPTYRHC